MEYLYLIWYVLALIAVIAITVYYLKLNNVSIKKAFCSNENSLGAKILGWILFVLAVLWLLSKWAKEIIGL